MNKFSKFILATLLVVCGTITAFAGQDEQNGHAYFTQAELPNMVNFLPPPPEFGSTRFAADESQYLWGLSCSALWHSVQASSSPIPLP